MLSTVSFTVDNTQWQVFSNRFGIHKRICHKSKSVKLYCCTCLPVILVFSFQTQDILQLCCRYLLSYKNYQFCVWSIFGIM